MILSNLIYYAWEPNGGEEGHHIPRQIVQSWRSLRRHDPEIDVVLLYGGSAPDTLKAEADRCRVRIIQVPSLWDILPNLTRYAERFRPFPTLCKQVFLPWLPAADRVLYVDADTYWFDSPRRLFERYQLDFHACAEMGSREFRGFDYNPAYMDVDAIAAIARAEGLAFVPPINTGTMIMSGNLCHILAARSGALIDFAARLLGFDADRPLKMPTLSWLVDELSLCLILGGIPNLTWGHIAPEHVTLSTLWRVEAAEERVLAHYFTTNQEEFFADMPTLGEYNSRQQ